MQYPLASSSKPPLKSSYLYPDQDGFSSSSTAAFSHQRSTVTTATTAAAASTTSSQSTRFDDPTNISFSPCGYYLCAFFPVPHDAATTNAKNNAFDPTPSNVSLMTNGLATRTLPTSSAPTITQLSANLPALDQSLPASHHIAATDVPPAPSVGPRARLCIWSRAETGALNDWKLVQTIICEPACSQSHAISSTKTENVLKVNEKGQSIPTQGLRASPSDADSGNGTGTLLGGVKHVVWLNRHRRIVLNDQSTSPSHYGASSFSRLASRGPSFIPTSTAYTDNSGPDQDLALVVFGHHGQVTLLSSCKADRSAAVNLSTSSPVDAASPTNVCQAFFSVMLQSSLYTPSVRPSPVTLDSAQGVGEKPAEIVAPYLSPFSANRAVDDYTSDYAQERESGNFLTHLAVGMPANDSVLLVASKRRSSSAGLIHITEITVDLHAESITMITRPLPPVSLSPADYAPMSHCAEDGTAFGDNSISRIDLDDISILSWAEIDSLGSNQDEDAGKSGCLRLVACTSHFEASGSDDSADHASTASKMHSTIAVWDLIKAENELSDAFGSLECRKTGHHPKWLEWQLRFTHFKVLTDRLVTSIVADASGLAVADLALLTALTRVDGGSGLLSEQVGFFDLKTVDLVQGDLSAVPAQALERCSNPVISSNGTLFATLASIHGGSLDKGVVMTKLPLLPCRPSAQHGNRTAEQVKTAEEESHLQMSQLLALSCLRKTDASDIGRAFAASADRENAGKLLVQVGDLLKITESKRQDVLVKIEGATQKGPSHDSNSIPFHQALRLLRIRMVMDNSSLIPKPAARIERLVLELGLCYQILRLARVKTEFTMAPSPPAPEGGKKKGGSAVKAAAAAAAAAGETRDRVYYRLESVWPLLAQLQWFLALLDGISKLALATTAGNNTSKTSSDANAVHAKTSSTTLDENSLEADFVRMLNKPTLRRLVLQIVAHFCDFEQWIKSTTKKSNLPPATGAVPGDETGGGFSASPEASTEARVLAVSEQMALARDALHSVVGDASIELAEFAQLLVKIEADWNVGGTGGAASGANQSRETDRFWWATLDGSKVDQLDGASAVKLEQDPNTGLQAKLLSSLVDPQSGALVDVLTLFISPSDISDEHNVLYDKGALDDGVGDQVGTRSTLIDALSSLSAKRSDVDERRDVVRKVLLQHAVTQASLVNDAATLLKTRPTTVVGASAAQRSQSALPSSAAANEPAQAESNLIRLSAMRAKRCVRCHALSQDPIIATYSLAPPPTSSTNPAAIMVDPNLAPQVQMQLQMQMQMHMMHMQLQMQHQQQPSQPGIVLPPMQPIPTFLPLIQPPPKLVSIDMPARASSLMDRFRFTCLCGGSWWVL